MWRGTYVSEVFLLNSGNMLYFMHESNKILHPNVQNKYHGELLNGLLLVLPYETELQTSL